MNSSSQSLGSTQKQQIRVKQEELAVLEERINKEIIIKEIYKKLQADYPSSSQSLRTSGAISEDMKQIRKYFGKKELPQLPQGQQLEESNTESITFLYQNIKKPIYPQQPKRIPDFERTKKIIYERDILKNKQQSFNEYLKNKYIKIQDQAEQRKKIRQQLLKNMKQQKQIQIYKPIKFKGIELEKQRIGYLKVLQFDYNKCEKMQKNIKMLKRQCKAIG